MTREVVMGIEEASFSMSCIHLKVLLGERAVGPRHCWRMGGAAKFVFRFAILLDGGAVGRELENGRRSSG